MTGGPLILRGDAMHLPLPDASVDLIVTSPPYFGLRSYTDGGAHYAGQVGAEPTPREYTAALVECTREWMRVLKPSGSIFVNLGDKYSTGSSGQSGMAKLGEQYRGGHADVKAKQRSGRVQGMPPKSLLLLPERYRIACVDELGLIARSVLVWSKPNGLPESVTDRVRRSHEDWVHLTKQPRYFAAVDEIRVPVGDYGGPRVSWAERKAAGEPTRQGEQRHSTAVRMAPNPLGKLPGSVWEIATQPLKVPAVLGVDHFAAFPMEWPRRLILGWSPREVCTGCGEGRRPVTTGERGHRRGYSDPASNHDHGSRYRSPLGRQNGDKEPKAWTITGYACSCPDTTAPSTPGVVLDPFGGTGTTAMVAHAHGRLGVSVDLSADYCRLATWRVNDPRQQARAAPNRPTGKRRAAPRLPQPDQLGLFTA